MSFTDHKITQFVHRIVDLPDQPNLPADELKARFDSSPEELRVAHNALCDDVDRLDDRVSGIIAETFGDTIDRSMLSDEFEADLDALETAMPLKCEVYFGTYVGTGTNQQIELGFQPKAVIVIDPTTTSSVSESVCFCGMGIQGNPILNNIVIQPTGFSINRFHTDVQGLCWKDHEYLYLAFQ